MALILLLGQFQLLLCIVNMVDLGPAPKEPLSNHGK